VFETLRLSLTDRSAGGAFVGLANYARCSRGEILGSGAQQHALAFRRAGGSTAFGLLAAQLTDRISWGNIAKSLIFMPMAISFVGAAVIFKLIYDTRPVGQDQIGILNAVWLAFDGGTLSVLFLKVVPVLLLAGFAVLMGFAIYQTLVVRFLAGKGAMANRTGGLMSCAVSSQLLRCG
jgi:alpha-glucoside transport system permease protein